MGPVPGSENGWGFVDTAARAPEVIDAKWRVWMETAWEESQKLCFKGLHAGDDPEEDDAEEEEDDEEVVSKKGRKKLKGKAKGKGKTKATKSTPRVVN